MGVPKNYNYKKKKSKRWNKADKGYRKALAVIWWKVCESNRYGKDALSGTASWEALPP